MLPQKKKKKENELFSKLRCLYFQILQKKSFTTLGYALINKIGDILLWSHNF